MHTYEQRCWLSRGRLVDRGRFMSIISDSTAKFIMDMFERTSLNYRTETELNNFVFDHAARIRWLVKFHKYKPSFSYKICHRF